MNELETQVKKTIFIISAPAGTSPFLRKVSNEILDREKPKQPIRRAHEEFHLCIWQTGRHNQSRVRRAPLDVRVSGTRHWTYYVPIHTPDRRRPYKLSRSLENPNGHPSFIVCINGKFAIRFLPKKRGDVLNRLNKKSYHWVCVCVSAKVHYCPLTNRNGNAAIVIWWVTNHRL